VNASHIASYITPDAVQIFQLACDVGKTWLGKTIPLTNGSTLLVINDSALDVGEIDRAHHLLLEAKDVS
jgi:hypothetical protein